jgi:hypothetical protein
LVQLKDEFSFDPALVERYIELMCEFSPQSVYQYITSSEGYRLENAMKVTGAFVTFEQYIPVVL